MADGQWIVSGGVDSSGFAGKQNVRYVVESIDRARLGRSDHVYIILARG
jgi:hypothetical protein